MNFPLHKASNLTSKIIARICAATLLIGIMGACQANSKEQQSRIAHGTWRFALQMQNQELPFTAEFARHKDGPKLRIFNGSEVIELSNPYIKEDTLVYAFPVYNTSLLLIQDSPDLLSGKWIDLNKQNYSIPLVAEYNRDFRFTSTKSSTYVASQYKVRFENKNSKGSDAILLLDNDQGKLTGTFLTETGDYRFLQGNIMNGDINLSTFDGSHAWLFSATITGDSLTHGHFFSGLHGHTSWYAVADSAFQLRSPESISSIKSGFDKFEFALTDESGKQTTHEDYIDGKTVTIYHITGSWCPNCMDAAVALQEITQEIGTKYLRVVPIHFEMTDDFEIAKTRVNKMKLDLGLSEHFLFGGKANKESVQKKLPALTQLSSYPTLIFTNKAGDVVKVYTGFYGPGTGKYYEQFKTETKSLLSSMLSS